MGKLASSFLAPFFFFFLLPLILDVAAVALTDPSGRRDFFSLASACPCPCPGTDNEAIVTFLFFWTTADAMLDRPMPAAAAGVTTIPVEPLIVDYQTDLLLLSVTVTRAQSTESDAMIKRSSLLLRFGSC